MPDQLYLSLWLRGFDASSMLRHFEELLRIFPFSHLRPGISGLRIYAVEFQEPALLEQAYAEGADVEQAISDCQEFENADCAYLVDGWWELWKHRAEWELAPARVSLICFGPEFDSDEHDHLRIELGPDSDFLPQPDLPESHLRVGSSASGAVPPISGPSLESTRKAESNVRGLLRLVREIEGSLPLERRKLWSESGEDFLERLEDLVSEW